MMKSQTILTLSTVIVQIVLFMGESGNAQTSQIPSTDSTVAAPLRLSQPTFAFLRDTLYVSDSVYLEVRLDKQVIYQHFRDGTVRKYLCSTGNPRPPDAIATREGLFNIQWKSKRYMSRQFEVWLNYWMPFDGGIGFHGLDGRSYYRYLGRRPSSHGCVRISNETGKTLFSSTPNGTLVFVHSGSPARLLQFADSTTDSLQYITDEHQELLQERLNAVLERRVGDTTLQVPLAIPAGKKDFRKISIGRASGIRPVQYPITPIRIPLLSRLPEARTGSLRIERTILPDRVTTDSIELTSNSF